MDIKITSGVGRASTEIVAFDEALRDAGIGQYNLIKLSSIIPPKANIKIDKEDYQKGKVGDKLYVVLSKDIETVEGKEACAGLGWSTEIDSKGGIFIEEKGGSEENVRKCLKRGFERSFEEIEDKLKNNGINIETTSIKCKGKPACAIVAAVYEHETWKSNQ